MQLSRRARTLMRLATALGLTAIYTPLLLVLVNSFNASRSFAWPPSGFSTRWWTRGLAGDRAARGARHLG